MTPNRKASLAAFQELAERKEKDFKKELEEGLLRENELEDKMNELAEMVKRKEDVISEKESEISYLRNSERNKDEEKEKQNYAYEISILNSELEGLRSQNEELLNDKEDLSKREIELKEEVVFLNKREAELVKECKNLEEQKYEIEEEFAKLSEQNQILIHQNNTNQDYLYSRNNKHKMKFSSEAEISIQKHSLLPKPGPFLLFYFLFIVY